MTIGQRIRLARRANQMSQRALAEAAGISAMAISKYERGSDIPSSSVLLQLARSLEVPVEYFFRPLQQNVEVRAFRKHVSLGVKEQDAIQARIQEWLERYFELEDLLHIQGSPEVLPEIPVGSFDEVESAAEELRRRWNLGMDAIENLTWLIEDRGLKIGVVDGFDDFDACTFKAREQPVIVTRAQIPGDRQRFNIAHEMGHLVLKISGALKEEKAAHRFAGAFLVPASTARHELGQKRSSLELHELALLKQKYGLSMQAWIYRAQDLEIISESTARNYFRFFRQQGWPRQEPGAQIPEERPQRLKLLVYRALAEDLISRSRAQELLGEPLNGWVTGEPHHDVFAAPSGHRYEHLD